MSKVEELYAKYLHDDDKVPTRAVHAAYVANMHLDGEPVWLLLIGGSGWGKTERIMPLADLPQVVCASTLTGEAALLSATSKKDIAEDATGGILGEIGDRGMLLLKDFTSVLSMNRDRSSQVIAALREIADGRWDRAAGGEGGRRLHWSGKMGMIAGCTTKIDSAHGIISELGQRWGYIRLRQSGLGQIATSALALNGNEREMREALAESSKSLLNDPPGKPHDVEPVRDNLIALACLVSGARSPVQRDHSGNLDVVLDREAPTRMVKALTQIWRASGMLGLDEQDSWEVVCRYGLDSVPKLRGEVVRFVVENPELATGKIAEKLNSPYRSVLRALEDLQVHGICRRNGEGTKDDPFHWSLTGEAHTWWVEGVTFLASKPEGEYVTFLASKSSSTSRPCSCGGSIEPDDGLYICNACGLSLTEEDFAEM